jgi:biopolymer transport protein ExbB
VVLFGIVLAVGMGLPGAAAADDSLEAAYKKEFAFLESQRRELAQRLERFQRQMAADEKLLETRIAELTDQAVALDGTIQRRKEAVAASERLIQENRDNVNLLEGLLEQGRATLKEYAGRQPEVGEDGLDAQVAALFAAGDDLLGELSGIRREPGEYFAADGSLVKGRIIRIGCIAAFGVGEHGSGALVPAGGGTFKLWPASTGAVAKALDGGEHPVTLGLFIFENPKQAVEIDPEETVVDYIASGGFVAWIIVGLGGVAALLILLRLVLLQTAGTSIRKLMEEIAGELRGGRVEAALDICRKRRGSAARVVAAALRSLGGEREQLENIVAENILNESSRLDRFATLVVVIAAVSPLLGLLGTVTGMISTFEVITKFGTGDPKLLSGGISTALVTTQLGLTVAIPTLLVGSLISAWSDRIKDDMEKAALRVTVLYDEAQNAVRG